MLLRIYGKVVHERIFCIRPRPVAVGCKGRILIVFALSDIAVCLPLYSGLEEALDIIPALVPVVLERSGEIQFLRVGHLV